MPQDDNIRRWAMYSVIAFNVTVIFFMIVFSLFRTGGMSGVHFGDFVITLLLAIIAAVGVFWASMKLRL
jgi:hypothetical protein